MNATASARELLRGPVDVREIAVGLETGDTDLETCRTLPELEYGATSFYSRPRYPLSIAALPSTGEEYEYGCSTVSRQNARHAAKLGYRHELIDRADWEDDLYALRSSATFRQGRDMPPAYLERQSYSSDAWPDPHCRRHLSTFHGVVGGDGHLAAYCQIVQCGEIARVNTILGHWDRMDDRVVWLLVLELVKWHIDEAGAMFALYYTHDSGHGPGLRYFKERLGFRPSRVTWLF